MTKLVGLQEEIWKKKYRFEDEPNIEATWRRVAKTVASVEEDQVLWETQFYQLLEDFKFIPGGRITSGAGTRNNYLLNCAVLEIEEDSISGIYETIKKAAVLAQSNYGVGFDFSKLRPKNSPVTRGGVASGPVSFMKVFDASGSIIETGGGRRAASIGVLRVDHPDIFEFIDAKREQGVLTQFNISVGITDEFLKAVKNGGMFDLRFAGQVFTTVPAKSIWDKLVDSGFNYNDPGLLMLDEVNRMNNGYYLYDIACTNPCGEIPLPPAGVCCLGSINLTKFIREPFSNLSVAENFVLDDYLVAVQTAVRFLDNVLDISEYPYELMRERAQNERRIGLCAVAGLGSALAMLKIPYETAEAVQWAEAIQQKATTAAYEYSVLLAALKGAFPAYAPEYLESAFIHRLDSTTRDFIKEKGIRNIALTTIPPVGTGSLLAGNISNGLEPIFALEYDRKVRQLDGSQSTEAVEDPAWKAWKSKNSTEVIPDYFRTSREISPIAHVDMQAALQKWIDGSISKTANIPENFTKKAYEELLWYAIDSGVKGFTTFREGTREGVLETRKEDKKSKEDKLSSKEPKKKRARVLTGKTYKVTDDMGNLYVTINDESARGKLKPFEIFIEANSENASVHSEWYKALAKLMSAVMRRTDDLEFLVKDLQSIYAPKGYFSDGQYVQSKPQMIGNILAEHLEALTGGPKKEVLSKCPECGEAAYSKEGGCGSCKCCGFAMCG